MWLATKHVSHAAHDGASQSATTATVVLLAARGVAAGVVVRLLWLARRRHEARSQLPDELAGRVLATRPVRTAMAAAAAVAAAQELVCQSAERASALAALAGLLAA